MQTPEAEIERLLAHPRFDRVAHRLAQRFLAVQSAAPRLASQFSTQQRWLMSHAALSRYFRGLDLGRPGLSQREFVEEVLAHGLASRNTAASFFNEALQYGLVQPIRMHAPPSMPASSPSTPPRSSRPSCGPRGHPWRGGQAASSPSSCRWSSSR